MSERHPPPDRTPLTLPLLEAYDALLHEAGDVAGRAAGRLRDLGGRYPGAVPRDVLDALDRARADPKGDRRTRLRLGGPPGRTAVRTGAGGPDDAAVLDQSAGGVRLRVGRPLAVGAVVGVRLAVGGCQLAWVAAQVRYCRRERSQWMVGCEFVGRSR